MVGRHDPGARKSGGSQIVPLHHATASAPPTLVAWSLPHIVSDPTSIHGLPHP